MDLKQGIELGTRILNEGSDRFFNSIYDTVKS